MKRADQTTPFRATPFGFVRLRRPFASFMTLLVFVFVVSLLVGCRTPGGIVDFAARGDAIALSEAIRSESSEALRTGSGPEALFAAAREDQVSTVRALIEAGVPIGARDAQGRTALHIAARHGTGPLLDYLIRAGAELSARDSISGATPLLLAAAADREVGIYHLVRGGAHSDLPESGGRGRTPLHAAVEAGASRAVRLLLQAGADVYAPDRTGNSALLKATASNDAALHGMFRLALAGRAGEIAVPKRKLGSERAAGSSATRFLTKKRKDPDSDASVYSLADLSENLKLPLPESVNGQSWTAPRRVDVSKSYGRRVAAVVGIDRYRRWPNLEGARRDSKRMAAELRALGFDEVLELYDREATRSRILTLLSQELAARTSEDDLAFIFFAGHGETQKLPDGSRRGFIVPTDASPTSVETTGISMETLRDLSKQLSAKHIFYAMDSCYSGLGLVRGIGMSRVGEEGYFEKVTSLRAVQMLTAGTEGELAIERDGEGLFTTYLIRALRGEADFDRNGVVTAGEIGVFVRPQVSAASGNRQTPQFGTLEGAGEVVFPLPRTP